MRTVRIPDDLHAALKEYCEKHETVMSIVARNAISNRIGFVSGKKSVAVETEPQLEEKVIPEDDGTSVSVILGDGDLDIEDIIGSGTL